jgi:hypothetical protein
MAPGMAPGMAPVTPAFALALGSAVMASEVKTAGGDALLQLLQLEIQVFHRVHLLSLEFLLRKYNLIVFSQSLVPGKPRQGKLHPRPP